MYSRGRSDASRSCLVVVSPARGGKAAVTATSGVMPGRVFLAARSPLASLSALKTVCGSRSAKRRLGSAVADRPASRASRTTMSRSAHCAGAAATATEGLSRALPPLELRDAHAALGASVLVQPDVQLKQGEVRSSVRQHHAPGAEPAVRRARQRAETVPPPPPLDAQATPEQQSTSTLLWRLFHEGLEYFFFYFHFRNNKVFT